MFRVIVLLTAVLAAVACLNPLPLVEDGGVPPPDAGVQLDAGPQPIAVEGCSYIGAFNRIGFRGEVSDAGPCVTLQLISPGIPGDGGHGVLELPTDWGVDSATSDDAPCAITWQGVKQISTNDVRGFVRFPGDGGGFPGTATLDVTLRFDGGPGMVRMAGFNVPLNASCLP